MPARSAEPRRDEARLRAAMVAAGRRLRAGGLVAGTEGNLSIRVGGALLITPSGRRKDELEPEDLLVAPGNGESAAASGHVGPRPSSDVAIHRAVYAARPDATAVVHAHLPASMALTLAAETPDPAVLPETALLLPRLPLVGYGTPGSAELAGRIGAALGTGPPPLPGAVLLERHGAVAVGDGDPIAALALAVDRLELVEVLCRAWRDALLLRAARTGRAGRAILRPPGPEPARQARGRT